MANLEDLREIYDSFVAFGSNRNLATGSNNNLNNDNQMDNQRFNKFCKDCKVIDGKNVTSTDCDILFNKMKPKGGRKVDWNTFVQMFRELAQKKYPSKNAQDAYIQLLAHVSDKGPIARATVTQTGGVFNKLLDTHQYTGTHKERFDADGTGRGLEGRLQPTNLTQQEITNRDINSAIPHNTQNSHTINGSSTNSVGAAKKRGQTAVVTASSEQLDVKSQQPKRQDAKSSNSNLNKGTTKGSNMSINKGSNASLNKGSNSSLNKPTSSYSSSKAGGSGSVFDRLTDVKGYTGSHKERFNADGTGRGLAGRQQNTGSLSQQQVTNRDTNYAVRSST